MVELPARLGGLSIINPELDTAQNFKDSKSVSKPLVEKFLSSDTDLDGVASRQKRACIEIQKENERLPKERKVLCCNRLSVHHTQEHLYWLMKEARQTGSQRCR